MKTYKSLQYRLIAAFFIIAAVVLVAVAAILYFITNDSIQNSFQQATDAYNKVLEAEVFMVYVTDHNWDNLQSRLEAVAVDNRGRPLHLIVTDADGYILADTFNSKNIGQLHNFAPYSESKKDILLPGTASESCSLYIRGSSLYEPDRFFGFFFVSCAAALAIAVVFSIVLSKRIINPVQKLTMATESLAAGKLNIRVLINDDSELGQLADAFNEMASEIESNHRSNKAMVADIAHELRTPLTNINGYLEAIQDGVVKPDARTITSLSEEAASLARLVGDLQQLSIAETSSLTLNMEEVDINILLQRAYLAKQHEASEHGIAVEYEETELPKTVADPQRIYQVISNLLNNAIAHTEQGTVLVKASHDDKNIKVSVIDTGEGIPESELANIFERFYRIDKSRSRKSGGTGLGLTIAKTLILGHKGHIGVESVQGVGSKFWFTIPIKNLSKKKQKIEELI